MRFFSFHKPKFKNYKSNVSTKRLHFIVKIARCVGCEFIFCFKGEFYSFALKAVIFINSKKFINKINENKKHEQGWNYNIKRVSKQG